MSSHLSTARRTRRPAVVAAAGLLVLLLTGCYRSDLGVTVEDDGSGQVEIVVAIDPERLAEISDQFGEDVSGLGDDPCAEIRSESSDTSDLPDGAEVEPYDEDGFCGVRIRAPFAAGTDIGAFVIDDLDYGSDAEADSPTTFESFVIERDGDGWRFEAVTSASTDSGDLGGGLFGGFLGDAENIVRVKLPGKVVEEDADRTEGGALVWDLDPLGERRTLSARTEPGGGDGSSALLWVVIAAIAVAAVVVGVLLWRRSRGRTPDAGTPGPAGGAPTPGAPVAGEGGPPAGAAPAAGAAPNEPQWDPARNAYIQWDPAGGRWMQYDQASGEWRPIA